jgi:hypothetical protein
MKPTTFAIAMALAFPAQAQTCDATKLAEIQHIAATLQQDLAAAVAVGDGRHVAILKRWHDLFTECLAATASPGPIMAMPRLELSPHAQANKIWADRAKPADIGADIISGGAR